MDRCALFVDAGYVLTDGAMAVHGTRRRESVSWDHAGLLQLFGSLTVERTRLPLLRCYWYEATVDGQRTADHEALADMPGVKLRVAKTRPGRREGVESEIRRDLTTLARNKAVSDVVVVSAEEDLAQVIAEVQDMGLRVTLLHIELDGSWAESRSLRQECDDLVELGAAHLRPYVELISGAEPPRQDEPEPGPPALRPVVNGNGHHMGSANGKAPVAGRVIGYGQQGRPEPEIMPAAETAQPEQDFGAVPDLTANVDYSASVDYGAPADYPAVPDQGPAAEYGAAEYGAAEYGAAFEYGAADHGHAGDYWTPSPVPPSPTAPVQQDVYAAPVVVPVSPAGAGVGSAQVRRLPTRDVTQAGPANTPPAPAANGAEAVLTGQPGAQPPGGQFQGGQFHGGQFQAGQPTGGQPVLPSVPIAAMEQNGSVAYAPARVGSHSGPRQSLQGHGGQVPPLAAPVPSMHQELAVPSGPIGLVGPGGYPGGAPGVSLGDAVQSAHEEGQAFGESVARDAPALWLEAVLARKPRMPSDLEARLLQGSALPIDFLLHDEVRHALRRGFWDALERTRR